MEWFNDYKYNNNLVRVQIESRKAIYIFLQIVSGATRISYLKGIEKIPENRSVFQNAL